MTGVVGKGFVVTGRVQRVGFRWWSEREAERLELDGAAWNRPDGAVEIHVWGAPSAVNEFRRALQEGPPSARVHEVLEVDPREDLADPGFRVLR